MCNSTRLTICRSICIDRVVATSHGVGTDFRWNVNKITSFTFICESFAYPECGKNAREKTERPNVSWEIIEITGRTPESLEFFILSTASTARARFGRSWQTQIRIQNACGACRCRCSYSAFGTRRRCNFLLRLLILIANTHRNRFC